MEMSRAVLLPFWNAYSFFVTYANVDGWKPKRAASANGGGGVSSIQPPNGGTELDRWIISLLNDVISSVNKEMEQYNLYKVVPHLVDFIDNLTNWYIRRSRRRFWKSENDGDKDLAYGTLYYVLVQFSKVMAPFLPFVTEAIYGNLVNGKLDGEPSSVHLASYPSALNDAIDEPLELKMKLVRQAVAMGRALRSRFTIKTRQPLSEFTVVLADSKKIDLIKDMEELVKDELNVKKVIFDSHEERVVSISAKPNFKKLGKMFGPKMKEASAIIEQFTNIDIKNLEGGKTIDVLGMSLTYDDIEIRRVKREGFEVETEGELTVGLDVTITPELKKECIAREFVNRVQNRRKDSGLNVSDRIIINCACPPEVENAVTEFRNYVCAETLAVDIHYGNDIKGAERVDIEGLDVLISVEKTKAVG
jgi:isoleucyl-tRNA synthetase